MHGEICRVRRVWSFSPFPFITETKVERGEVEFGKEKRKVRCASGFKIHVVSRLLIGIVVEPRRELALIMQGISSSRGRRGRDKDACQIHNRGR